MRDDILHAPHPQGAGRPVQPARAVHRHADGLLEEPEGGQGLPALVPHRADLRAMVVHRSRASPSAPPRCGRTTSCGRSIRSCCRSAPLPRAAAFAGYAGPPNRKAAEVISKYIIVDMYAKAIQGMAPRTPPNGHTASWSRSTPDPEGNPSPTLPARRVRASRRHLSVGKSHGPDHS